MKKSAEAWDDGLPFGGPRPGPAPSPLEEGQVRREDDSPAFAAIRRIELLGRLHHMAFRNLLREEGMSPAQMGALRDIIRDPGMSQRELADRLHIQRATATVMLQKMEKAGYIDRRPDKADQRISRIYPTEQGRSLETENRKKVAAYFDRVLTGVDREHFEVMMQSMEVFRDNLRDILDESPEPRP